MDPLGGGRTLLSVDLVDGVDDGLVDCVLGLVEVNKYHSSGLINPNHHVSTVGQRWCDWTTCVPVCGVPRHCAFGYHIVMYGSPVCLAQYTHLTLEVGHVNLIEGYAFDTAILYCLEPLDIDMVKVLMLSCKMGEGEASMAAWIGRS
jgi:hypothetical protein